MVLELKIIHKGLAATLEQGLRQTWEYMDRCGTQEGHLVLFDRNDDTSWEQKLFRREAHYHNHLIFVWGM